LQVEIASPPCTFGVHLSFISLFKMNDLFPNKTSQDNDFDWDLVLTFLTDYLMLEGALVQAGFTQAGCRPGNPQPDWKGFARHIAGKFDPDSSPELMGAVCTLLADPEDPGFFRKRRTEPSLWEPSIPERNTAWLGEVVQQIRDQLLLQINFVQIPACDDTSLAAALVLVDAWAIIDPKVESLLARGL
jgi:hypothetical protein